MLPPRVVKNDEKMWIKSAYLHNRAQCFVPQKIALCDKKLLRLENGFVTRAPRCENDKKKNYILSILKIILIKYYFSLM